MLLRLLARELAELYLIVLLRYRLYFKDEAAFLIGPSNIYLRYLW